jgi:hypothetical protein
LWRIVHLGLGAEHLPNRTREASRGAGRPRCRHTPRTDALGRRIKILVGKPGLDGHSNGAEQIAVRARNAGMDVVYEGIRLDVVAEHHGVAAVPERSLPTRAFRPGMLATCGGLGTFREIRPVS